VAKAKDKKWPMTIASPKKDDSTPPDKKALADNTPGLHFWHSYAIIDVDPVNDRIKLFNPWGTIIPTAMAGHRSGTQVLHPDRSYPAACDRLGR
jgi:hypothetical protein